jgi:hypothetical protein
MLAKEEVAPEASDHAFDAKNMKVLNLRMMLDREVRLILKRIAKEQAEGNNELAGTTPTQVGQDGKNMPGGG